MGTGQVQVGWGGMGTGLGQVGWGGMGTGISKHVYVQCQIR